MPPNTRPIMIAIPAYNEAATIAECVTRALTASREAGLNPCLVVANDQSSDETAALAAAAGATVIDVAHRQIAAVRNSAARAALAHPAAPPAAPDDLLVFIDGDTLVSAILIRAARAALDRGAPGGGARTTFDDPTPFWARATVKLLAGPLMWWWGYAGGCFLYCRRDVFEATGGFDERYFVAEEIHFLRAVKRLKRGKVRILREASLTSGRKLRTHTPWAMVKAMFRVLRTKGVTRDGLGLWYDGNRVERKSAPRP